MAGSMEGWVRVREAAVPVADRRVMPEVAA